MACGPWTAGFSLLKDEMAQMRTALENDREYELPEHHDPVKLLFDNTFHIGASKCGVGGSWGHCDAIAWSPTAVLLLFTGLVVDVFC
jgi:hypothetical protein